MFSKYSINLILLGFMPFVCFSASSCPVNMTKLFYHQGVFGDKVVCYFDKQPRLISQASSEGTQENTIELFLPMTKLADSQARSMMKKVNNTPGKNYSITFKEEEKGEKGIKVCITYKPEVVFCDYATCDAICQQKSLVFHFHNKKELESVQSYNGSILRQVSIEQKPRITLDFGHGGDDNGKVGCNKVKEKDINFQVGKKLAQLLCQNGYEVLLTRKDDLFVPLDERTRLANTNRSNLFISLHSNAGPNKDISGIETYWTSLDSLKRVSLSKSSLDRSLSRLYGHLDTASQSLASTIHNHVVSTLSCNHPVVNRKVKQSVSQVLLGTDMPSALIEMGFLSNPNETKRLSDHNYQNLLAQGIYKGIESYCKQKLYSF